MFDWAEQIEGIGKMTNPKNGSQTFTNQGRIKGAQKHREYRSGWPKWKKGAFEAKMIELNRRFDEPGMILRVRV
jgi:hypothetical protein